MADLGCEPVASAATEGGGKAMGGVEGKNAPLTDGKFRAKCGTVGLTDEMPPKLGVNVRVVLKSNGLRAGKTDGGAVTMGTDVVTV